MKKFSLFLVAVFLLSTAVVTANDKTKKKPQQLTDQISNLLSDNQFVVTETQEITAQVKFMINDNGEIVVLSVATADARLEAFVKGRLNYQKVLSNDFKAGRYYTIPVRITA